ncbi:MAG: nicotinate-nucleotide adenylyltransferase, partial [Rhodobacteraceae bacterium]|nr:nicotinate-nucleotide adenylyltransferase [Paracoccaceae bacterium]
MINEFLSGHYSSLPHKGHRFLQNRTHIGKPLPRHSLNLPHSPAGSRIGLLGGSFDPPHSGHLHITNHAFKALGLDQVWWLASIGNPLKPNPPAPLRQRMQAAEKLIRHPRVTVTDLEARLGATHTADTLRFLHRRFPETRFIWLMGGDNLPTLHHWSRWRQIINSIPICVFARPPKKVTATISQATRKFA